MDNYFNILNAVNVNEHTEKKNGLTYLSWAWAWAEVKKAFPDATYKIYENKDEWNYFTDGKTAWVKTSVTVNGIENIEYLPVMDSRNKSIPVANITSFDVNKAIQRSLTKACARHGLGLYIYAGEDLPEEETIANPNARPASANPVLKCELCNATLTDGVTKSGAPYPAADLARDTKSTFGKCLCRDCAVRYRKAKEAEAEMS